MDAWLEEVGYGLRSASAGAGPGAGPDAGPDAGAGAGRVVAPVG